MLANRNAIEVKLAGKLTVSTRHWAALLGVNADVVAAVVANMFHGFA